MKMRDRGTFTLAALLLLYPAIAESAALTTKAQILIDQIKRATQEPDLISRVTINRIFIHESPDRLPHWIRTPATLSDSEAYKLAWSNGNHSSGIRTITLIYAKASNSAWDGWEEIDLQLNGDPCVTVSDLQSNLGAKAQYSSLTGLAEPWAPNPPVAPSGQIASLTLANKFGREEVIDNLLAPSPANCLLSFRIWTNQGLTFMDKAPS